MNFSNKNTIIILSIFLIVLTTITLIFFINLTKQESLKLLQKILKQEAIAHFDNMVDTRTWNSQFNGVYVKPNKDTKINSYLDEKYVQLENGSLLIKINPVTMTRQISEITNKNSHYLFNITSLDPINPKNRPDKFEKEGLLFLKNNKEEKFFTKIENDNYNLIGSLRTEVSCLKCHQEQNYKLGEVRGGLRVSIPLDNYYISTELIKSNSFILVLVTIFFAFIITLLTIFFINLIYKRQETIEKLNSNLEIKIKQRTKELEKNVKKLNKLAIIDYLTNIPNRRYFFDLGEKIFLLSKRENKDLALLLLDIDLFKNINDTYGHDIGDKVLVVIAKTIEDNIRNSDILTRFGGEKFIVLLNNTDINQAKKISSKIKDSIENLNYENINKEIKTTISIGISINKKEDINLNCMIKRADIAMYQSKSNGRNCISVEI